jgi:hypothetical protein
MLLTPAAHRVTKFAILHAKKNASGTVSQKDNWLFSKHLMPPPAFVQSKAAAALAIHQRSRFL